MAKYGKLTVGTTAVKVPVGKAESVVIIPVSGDVFWGYDDDVTPATGMPCTGYEFPHETERDVFVVAAAAGADVRWAVV